MSNTRYLEITSDYRNRNLYPLPSQFDVEISQTGIKDKVFALDPISNATPLLIFNGSLLFIDQGSIPNTQINGHICFTNIPNTNSIYQEECQHKLTLKLTGDVKFNNSSFYNGLIISILNLSNLYEYRRIISSDFISNTQMVVTLESAFSVNVQNDSEFTINNSSYNTTNICKIFIPFGSNSDNYYINYLLEDTTLSEFMKIISYDGLSHLATLEYPFSNAWDGLDSYILRKEMPCQKGILQNTNNDGLTYSSFILENNTINYTGDFLRIPYYMSDTDNGIRKIIRFQTPITSTIGLGSTVNNIIIYVNGLNKFYNKNGYYVGFYISIGNEIRLITSYILNYNINNIVTSINIGFTSDFSSITIGDILTISGGVVYPQFDGIAPLNINSYEILGYSRDNAVPFNYTGSTVSQQEDVCYEIELRDLVLPNETLIVGKGSKITFYPYVYIELSNVSSPGAGQRGILYSNNPNSNKMLFRCPMDDIPNPLISPFIKISGDGTVQTIKFKINDNLRFSVRLPSGEIFETKVKEQYSPLPPNPMCQISAFFSLKRL